jgi:hypothetical protein
VALVVSLLLHALLLLAGTGPGWLADSPADDRPNRAAEPEVELGEPQAELSRVAWISHEAFENLMARKASATRQPAVQREAEPVENAPPRLDSTPPAPSGPEAGRPGSSSAPVLESLGQEAPSGGLPETPTAAGEVPFDEAAPAEAQQTQDATQAADAESEAASQSREGGPQQPASSAAEATREPRPTSAARSDQAAPPTDLEVDPSEFRLGEVLAGKGLKIQTARLQEAPLTMLRSRGARLPTVRLTFDTEGKPIDATMVQSTGYEDLDFLIEASLFRWRASGPQLDKRNEPVEVTIRFVTTEKND